VDRDIFVIGEAADADRTLEIRKPSEKGKKFMISIKSEEELKRSLQGSMTASLIGGIVLGIGGIVVVALKIIGIISN